MRILQNVAVGLLGGVLVVGCSGGSSGGGAGGPSATNTTVSLTDAPSDELSVLQVELTGLTVIDANGSRTQVFPGPSGGTLTVNLLRLRGVSRLLSSLTLPAGTYTAFELTYRGATALDNAGNRLTVSPSGGTSVAMLAPALTVGATHQLVELDFKVDDSVRNLVTGPGGSLALRPVLQAEIERNTTHDLEDFKAQVVAVRPRELDVQVGSGALTVELAAGAVVLAGGSVVTGSGVDLTTLVSAGAVVELRGSFSVARRAIQATSIEVEDGQHFGGGAGPQAQGLVVAVAPDRLSVLILDARDSGLQVGSTQQIALTSATRYGFSGFPSVSADASSVEVGQEVRVFGTGTAAAVLLRETRLEGVVASIGPGANQVQLTVDTLEYVKIAQVPGLTNPVTVEFPAGRPGVAQVGARIEVEGQFARTAPGVFAATPAGAELETEDDQLEGTQVALIGESPLRFSLTGDGGRLGNPFTATVSVPAGASIVERSAAGVSTPVSAIDLAAGIRNGRYTEVRARGTYDASAGVLTATDVRADVP